MVLDHLHQACAAEQGRTLGAEHIAVRARSLHEPQASGGAEQPRRGRLRQVQGTRQLASRERAALQVLEQPQPHAGAERLRIDEAGYEVEQTLGPRVRHRAGQREVGGPALEARVGEHPIAGGEPGVAQRAETRRNVGLSGSACFETRASSLLSMTNTS